jgi:hypothetical protein
MAILKGSISPYGYRQHDLMKEGNRKGILAGWLVLAAFIGNKPTDGRRWTMNHKNGNKLDDSSENLEWLTAGDNVRHAFANGLNKPHAFMGRIRIPPETVVAIRRATGTQQEIARSFGVSQPYVSAVRRGVVRATLD